MTQVRKIMLPTHPDAKAACIERNLRLGWRPVPGISDHEMGTILQNDDDSAVLWIPPHVGPPMRLAPLSKGARRKAKREARR